MSDPNATLSPEAIVSPEPIVFDIWSDIACPWCYIGKRNLESGIAELQSELGEAAPEIAITFHSYELSPDTPVDFDGDEVDFLAGHKGMPRDAGLAYRFDLLQHTNTVKAHELLHYAKAHGRQAEMEERLMSAYFTEGRHVGRVDDLVELASEVGLDAGGTRAALESSEYLSAVRDDQRQAEVYGIQGVPFFVIDGKFGVSGAQPPAAFAQIIRQVIDQRAESPAA
jgi:predicted DsbA family dithiol-disulfide isomerase